MGVLLVAFKQGVGIIQVFNWRKLEREGRLTAVTAGETVMPASELAAYGAQIAQVQWMLGGTTMEAKILKAAVKFDREKKWRARSTFFLKDDQ